MKNAILYILITVCLVGVILYLYRENTILSTKLKEASYNNNLNEISNQNINSISSNLKSLNREYQDNSYLIRLSAEVVPSVDVTTICKQNNGIDCLTVGDDGTLKRY